MIWESFLFHPWLDYIAWGIQCVSFAQIIQIKKKLASPKFSTARGSKERSRILAFVDTTTNSCPGSLFLPASKFSKIVSVSSGKICERWDSEERPWEWSWVKASKEDQVPHYVAFSAKDLKGFLCLSLFNDWSSSLISKKGKFNKLPQFHEINW